MAADKKFSSTAIVTVDYSSWICWVTASNGLCWALVLFSEMTCWFQTCLLVAKFGEKLICPFLWKMFDLWCDTMDFSSPANNPKPYVFPLLWSKCKNLSEKHEGFQLTYKLRSLLLLSCFESWIFNPSKTCIYLAVLEEIHLVHLP